MLGREVTQVVGHPADDSVSRSSPVGRVLGPYLETGHVDSAVVERAVGRYSCHLAPSLTPVSEDRRR